MRSVVIAFAAGGALARSGAPAASARIPIFRPDAAIAGSEYGSGYEVQNTINGSGMPVNFGSADHHGNYTEGNQWSSKAGAINSGDAWARFAFDEAVGITHFHRWNHQSASHTPGYDGFGVTLFNLFLKDANGVVLREFLNMSADGRPGTSAAQTFEFTRVANVRQVDFVILDTYGDDSSKTGLAEVAFGDYSATVAPEPATMILLGSGHAGLAGAARRRRKPTTR